MKELVILSAAKDHLAEIERLKMILRFAQDDKVGRSSGWRGNHAKAEF